MNKISPLVENNPRRRRLSLNLEGKTPDNPLGGQAQMKKSAVIIVLGFSLWVMGCASDPASAWVKRRNARIASGEEPKVTSRGERRRMTPRQNSKEARRGMAPRQDSKEAKRKAASDYERERLKKLETAEKRAPNDPIRVAVFSVKAQKPFRAGEMSNHFQAIFDRHPVIKRHDQKRVNDFEKKSEDRQKFSFATKTELWVDVTVKTSVGTKQVVGFNRNTKKIGKGVAMVLEAVVESRITGQTFRIQEKASVFDNKNALTRLAKKAQTIIMNKIGPRLPKDRLAFTPASEDGEKGVIDIRDLSSDQKVDLLKKVWEKF